MKDNENAILRPYQSGDREVVRKICCDTAYRNQGSELYFEDRELHADYWTSYYTDVTPEQTWVAEIDGEVVGYFFGCTDTIAYRRCMARRIVPWVLIRAFWRLATGQYRNPMTRRYLKYMLFTAPGEEPKIDIRKYPAHYHGNFIEAAHGRRLLSGLALDFLDRLEEQGITHIHGYITEPVRGGVWQRFHDRFERQDKLEDHYVHEVPTRINEILLGDPEPWVNRVWGGSIESYRRFVIYVREKFRV